MRVWGLGFRDEGFGLRAGLGFRVWGLEFWVLSSSFGSL